MGEFRMPSLGADMDEGTVLEWRVRPGDHVERGDVIAVVDTDKSAIDVEIFQAGVVDELLVAVGECVPVGTVLARIADSEPMNAGEPATPSDAGRRTTVPAPVPHETRTSETAPPPAHPAAQGQVRSPLLRRLATAKHLDPSTMRGSGPGGRVTRHDIEMSAPDRAAAGPFTRSSPYARRLARDLGVQLAGVRGTGPGGAVVARDVPALAARPAAAVPGPVGADHRASMRRRIAELMTRSSREIPQYHLSSTIDLDDAMRWLRSQNERAPVTDRLLPAALLLHATAVALTEVTGFNGFYSDGAFRPSPRVHLGVAIALRGGGLLAPAIHDAHLLDVHETMAALRNLTAGARAGRLRASELSEPTVTVTDLGDRSADVVQGIIYPPQVALIGFGQIADRPVAVDGATVVHPVVTATITADHRVTDGHAASRLLQAIDRHLHELGGTP
ncbi:dihydrolipoamide acetyltransferase family protein [Desertimonas flava]|uniref:dihydrolipoamide acetyltransferase family protein n=1 Tax=Desertimonas flava TaxID=2064846 RepID=UPI000E357DA9|nr:dihydrolipoamide acetyltransferase family protein [Desertimonas flava]